MDFFEIHNKHISYHLCFAQFTPLPHQIFNLSGTTNGISFYYIAFLENYLFVMNAKIKIQRNAKIKANTTFIMFFLNFV